jgi:hypothetical protein
MSRKYATPEDGFPFEYREQPQDCCGPLTQTMQGIKIEYANGGGGFYAVISSTRWALDLEDLDPFVESIKNKIVELDKKGL